MVWDLHDNETLILRLLKAFKMPDITPLVNCWPGTVVLMQSKEARFQVRINKEFQFTRLFVED